MIICKKCGMLRQKITALWRYRGTLQVDRKHFGTMRHIKSQSLEEAWVPVIGLEIHAQINSESKLFSSARNQFMAPPNSLVSAFDAALPGTLPVLNKSCVEAAVLTAYSLQCDINRKSYFDRKHYFYADLPQGYQITQHAKPIAEKGCMSIPATLPGARIEWKNIKIEQIQLEQDSGKSLHDNKEGISLIDLNRAGVGLMEIVTAPDFRSAEEAATFVLDLQLTMQKLGTCAGKISEGNMRVDANISVHRPGEPLGIRSEVKNIAGISSLMQAIDYEIARHKRLLDKGERIVNETREFDAAKGITISMRDKEEFQDYRFMPEPNLPPLVLHSDKNLPASFDPECQVNIDDIKRRLPEILPTDLRRRLVATHGLDIEGSSFLMEYHLAEYFLSVMEAAPSLTPVTVFHWLKIHLLGLLYDVGVTVEQSPVAPCETAELLMLLERNHVNEKYAALTFAAVAKGDGSPEELVEKNGWKMISDVDVIREICRRAIEAKDSERLFKKYRRGEHKRPKNRKAVASIVNDVIAQTNDRAHTKVTQTVTRELLDEYFLSYQATK